MITLRAMGSTRLSYGPSIFILQRGMLTAFTGSRCSADEAASTDEQG